MLNIISEWKHNMEILGFEPISILNKKQTHKQSRELSRSVHPDKGYQDQEDIIKLNNALDFLDNNTDIVQKHFNNYLHKTFKQHFLFADISTENYVSDNAELLGKVFYAFGEMDHY